MWHLYAHPACRDHDTGAGHPERPARLAAVLDAIEQAAIPGVERRQAAAATREQLERVHPAAFLDQLAAAVPAAGLVRLDADTVVSPGSLTAALHAAGAACAAVDAVMTGETLRAFCAVRPPGHHAEPGRAMGFCLVNGVAVAAAQAKAVHGARRVAIVDFDVHHGNGTQAACEGDPTILYVSTHQWPLYPGTGAADDRGPLGHVVNATMPAGTGSLAYRRLVERQVLPAVDAFAPDLLLLSAGFDAHADDPLAQVLLEVEDFIWLTGELVRLAERHAGGKVVSVLEGGYDLPALGASAAAHVRALAA